MFIRSSSLAFKRKHLNLEYSNEYLNIPVWKSDLLLFIPSKIASQHILYMFNLHFLSDPRNKNIISQFFNNNSSVFHSFSYEMNKYNGFGKKIGFRIFETF